MNIIDPLVFFSCNRVFVLFFDIMAIFYILLKYIPNNLFGIGFILFYILVVLNNRKLVVFCQFSLSTIHDRINIHHLVFDIEKLKQCHNLVASRTIPITIYCYKISMYFARFKNNVAILDIFLKKWVEKD